METAPQISWLGTAEHGSESGEPSPPSGHAQEDWRVGVPWIVTIFISDVDADIDTRNAALQEIGGTAMSVIRN